MIDVIAMQKFSASIAICFFVVVVMDRSMQP